MGKLRASARTHVIHARSERYRRYSNSAPFDPRRVQVVMTRLRPLALIAVDDRRGVSVRYRYGTVPIPIIGHRQLARVTIGYRRFQRCNCHGHTPSDMRPMFIDEKERRYAY